METIDYIKKGSLSFVIGFIITIVIGVVLAIISDQIGFQTFILSGGLPLSWLYYTQLSVLGIYITIDYTALVLDILFWTFIIFLILTRKKIDKRTKEKKSVFKIDLSDLSLKDTIIIIACIIAFIVLIVMVILMMISIMGS